MKVLLTMFVSVVIVTVFTSVNVYSSNVVNRGRYYCPIHNKIYDPQEEVHRDCVLPTREITKPQERVQQQPQPYTYRSGPTAFISNSLIDIDIVAVKRPPVGYRVYRQYGGYYGYGSGRNYYNLSGKNCFRNWFGNNWCNRDYRGGHHRHHRHRGHCR